MGNFFGSLKRFFRGSGELRQGLEARGTGERRQDVEPESPAGVPYKSIGYRYEVKGVLGKGGFGVVYLVYDRDAKGNWALKTFRDEYLADAETRERFRREAEMWANMGRHPYLVWACFIDEFDGRLYIPMEYIAAPDEKGKLNTLQGYLDWNPPDLAQSLRWAIQFCHGMEYAYSTVKDFHCHRDIKPANIMITRDKTVKITDLGLAGVLDSSKAASEIKVNIHHGRVGLSSCGNCCGTPTHMPPEQFTNPEGCDQRSDIYSFGIVLYQMASGGSLPFLAPLPINDSEEEKERFWREMHRLHSEETVPSLNSHLFPIIQRCLKKEPGDRYPTFEELRRELEPLLKRKTGEVIKPPEPPEPREAWEWNNKGMGLHNLGRYEEAIQHYDKALEIDPRFVYAWNNKGLSLHNLGRYEEAIQHYDKALEIDPRFVYAWNNKGNSLDSLGRFNEAITCFSKATNLNQGDWTWLNKGVNLLLMRRFKEAIDCFDRVIKLNPRDALAWYNKGSSLCYLSRFEEGIFCFDRAIELDPMNERFLSNREKAIDAAAAIKAGLRVVFSRPPFLDE